MFTVTSNLIKITSVLLGSFSVDSKTNHKSIATNNYQKKKPEIYTHRNVRFQEEA